MKHGICAVTDLGSISLQRTNIFAVTQKGETMNDFISRQAAIDAINKAFERVFAWDGTSPLGDKVLENVPSAQPQTEWNNHTVACLLAELFGDACACNYNGIDEWLPEKCEVIDACPNPVGVACWEQFLKHRAERRNDED